LNLICGINPVLEALSAGSRHFDRLLVAKGLRNRRVSEVLSQASRMAIPLRFETRETLDRMAGGVPHQGLIAVVSAKPVLSLEALLDSAQDPALFLVLDGVEDPRNLGAILRTAEAAGADGVLLPERHSAGLSETVSRASAGALEHVRVARIGNVAQTLEALKARGVWVVGFDAAGTERWDAVDYRRPVALVLGGEGRGIRRLVRERCDHLASLPLFGHVGSLNVGVAAGIALYEVIRQRGAIPSHVRPIPARAAPTQIVGPAPDDTETDPGASPARPEGGEEEPEDDVLRLVQVQEEAAWAGPTVLKPIGFSRRDRMRKMPGRRHPHEGRGPAAPTTAAPTTAAPGPAPGASGREAGRGKRRRRGRRAFGEPRPAGDQGAQGAPESAAKAPEEGVPSVPAGGTPPGRRRRRRRRRR
jgi:23S rRNA (guanosine2251-2'-O)-methyltransferase